MTNERNSLKAGLFIMVSLALVVAIIVGIKGASRFLEPQRTCVATFTLADDIGGLRIGDDVRVGGLRQGVVKDLEFVSDSSGKPMIQITFSLPKRIDLRKDARVSIQSTVTGASNLNIDNLGAAAALADGDKLVGSASGLSTLLAAVGEMGPELKGTISDVRKTTLPKVNNAIDKAADTAVTFKTTGEHATDLIKTIRAKIDPMVERYFGLADKSKEAMGNISDLFGDTKTDFRTTVSNLSVATTSVKEKLPSILEKLDGGLAKVQKSLDAVSESLEDIKKTAANARDITASGRAILVGNKSKIDGMIASMKVTGDNLKNASAEIRRSPWRLLYKPGAGEVANLNLYDSARQFAEGANDLNDASTALRDALNDPNVDKETVEKLVDKLDKSFENFGQVEATLWKKVKE